MRQFGIREILDCTFYDLTTDAVVAHFDTLKTSDLSVASETVYAMGGRGNAKLIGWDGDKDVTVAVQDALLSDKGLQILTGNSLSTGATTVYKRERLTVSATDTITLAQTPLEAATAIQVLLYNTSTGVETEVDMSDATILAKVVTLGTSANLDEDDVVNVYYTYTSGATSDTYSVTSYDFAGSYKVVGYGLVRDYITKSDQLMQIIMYNAKVDGSFTVTMAATGDPSVFDMKLTLLRDPLTNKFFDMIHV